MSSAYRDYEAVTRSMEAWWRGGALEQVARLREDASADSHVRFASRHAFASSREAHDVLGEALERGTAPEGEVAAWAAHAAAAARGRALASVRDSVASHAARRVVGHRDGLDFVALVAELRTRVDRAESSYRDVAREAERARGPITEARAAAAEAAMRFDVLAAKRPDAIDEARVRQTASDFLARTEELLGEARDYLEHRLRAPLTAQSLLFALGAHELDDAFRTDAFRARVVALGGPLGLSETLARRVHLEPPHPGAGPRAELVYVDPPFDVRVSPSRLRGILGEASLLEGVGRATAVSLVAPAFSFAHRLPLEGTVPRALGGLFVRLVFDRARLGRERRMPDAVQDASRRLVAITTLLSLRLVAASVTTPSLEGEAAEASVRRALGFRVGEHVAALLLLPSTQPERFVGGLAGLSLFTRLRERYDEDFDRNPRTHEAIRGLCERGGSVSVDTALAELDGPSDPARALHDWVNGR